MVVLNADFASAMQERLGAEWPAFLEAMAQPAPVSIRINPFKYRGTPGHDGQVPWCAQGYYLAQRPAFILDPLWHAGAYYVQEASSMAIAEAVRQWVGANRSLRVLDLAAAPGGKSTLLAALLSSDSLLVANEPIRSRYDILKQNLVRWGLPNVLLANHDPQDFAPLSGWFDVVLVDAPCSGEGLWRKDAQAMQEWSLQQVDFCAARQRRILTDAVALLAPGGTLLYSTCTYNDTENSANARWLCDAFGLEPLSLHWPAEWGIAAQHLGYQFYPHRVRGEGFYLAGFRSNAASSHASARVHPALRGKNRPAPSSRFQPVATAMLPALHRWVQRPAAIGLWQDRRDVLYAVPQSVATDAEAVLAALPRAMPVWELGQMLKGDLLPAHALALSVLRAEQLPALNLDLAQATRYLRKEDPQVDNAPKNWFLACYEGYALGWAKGLSGRVNNYLPKGWRVMTTGNG